MRRRRDVYAEQGPIVSDPAYWEGNMYYRVTYPAMYESPYPLVMARNRHLSSTYRYMCVYSGTWWSGASMWLD